MADDLFKIKPVGGKNIIVEDKRKTISPFNSAKHFKDANIPAYCDQCIYRSIDSGGNGKCPKYEKGAVCSIRDDYIKIINMMDTRKPDDVKAMLDMIAKISFENIDESTDKSFVSYPDEVSTVEPAMLLLLSR